MAEKYYNEDGVEVAREGGIIPKSHLIKAWFIWETFPQCCYNYERMMGQSIAHTFTPVIDDLYKDDPSKRKDVMKRESEFFNVHIEFGACIPGMAIAMEEEKSINDSIPGEFITNIKTSLMGPLAGMGDSIWQGVVIPILLAICIDITTSGDGNIWGAIIYAVVIIVAAYLLSYFNFMFGYKAGSEAVLDFLEKGTLNKVLEAASIMGCIVMAGLVVNFVSIECGLTFEGADNTIVIQEQLDSILPGLIPLGMTMLVYYLLKKRWTSIKIILLLVVIGIVCGWTGILVYVG